MPWESARRGLGTRRMALGCCMEGCPLGHLKWAAATLERKGVMGRGSHRRPAGVTLARVERVGGGQSDLGTGWMLGGGRGTERGWRQGWGRILPTGSARGWGWGELSEAPLSPLRPGKRQDVGMIRFLAHIEIC